jgi:pilus assembly protein Flp/PilA
MRTLLRSFCTDESGATAIEYCLIASLIALVIVTALTTLGTNLKAKYNAVASGFR